MKRVTVLILNWNGSKLLQQFLPSVQAHTPADIADIVVADNGSTDDSLEMLRTSFPSVGIIELDRNYGFAEGYNRAMAQVMTEYTVLLNSDVEVTPGWLEPLMMSFASDPKVCAVQPKILSHRQRDHFEYAGAAGGFIDRYGYPFCRGRLFDVVEKDTHQYDTPCDILWASGACLMIDTATFNKEGGFDINYFAHQEEIDLCWRLRNRGYRVVCMPQSVVYHVGGATLNMGSPRKTFLNFRNNLLTLYKNLPEKDLEPVFRARAWLDYLAAFKFFITGQFAHAKAVHHARKAYKELLPQYVEIREASASRIVSTPLKQIYPGSLIIAFYLKGKKTFGKLFQR